MDTNELINKIVGELTSVKEIKAVVLGGSYATGLNRSDSDIDFGLYYEKQHPLDINKLSQVIEKLGAKKTSIICTIGEWGRWMNGGTWLKIGNQRVDFIYREIGFVNQTIDECLQGKYHTDYYQQPAFGFYSYIYNAETKYCKTLYDPSQIVSFMKQKVILIRQH